MRPGTLRIDLSIHAPKAGERLSRKELRGAFHQLACQAMEHFRLQPYEIQQTLEALGSFWAHVSNRTKKLENYRKDFGEL